MKRVDHILVGCEVLARNEHITRHNKAAAYLHWKICQHYDIEVTNKWYEHKLDTVMHNTDNNITILWDMAVNTDKYNSEQIRYRSERFKKCHL